MPIIAVYCRHCERWGLASEGLACRCGLSWQTHVVCGECARTVEPEHLGVLLAPLELAELAELERRVQARNWFAQ